MKHRLSGVIDRQIMLTFGECMKTEEKKFELTGLGIEHCDCWMHTVKNIVLIRWMDWIITRSGWIKWSNESEHNFENTCDAQYFDMRLLLWVWLMFTRVQWLKWMKQKGQFHFVKCWRQTHRLKHLFWKVLFLCYESWMKTLETDVFSVCDR